MRTLGAILGTLLCVAFFGAIGVGVGHALYLGLCAFFNGVWEQGPEIIIYSPYVICGIAGIVSGIAILWADSGWGLAVIPVAAIGFIGLLITAIIVGALISQGVPWPIVFLIGLCGTGGTVVYIIFE